MSQVAQPRDALDIAVAVFTISTGVVLAAAASMAFIMQRGRYFREIEPDLRVTSPNVRPGSHSRDSTPQIMLPTIKIRYQVQNVSQNDALIYRTDVHLDVLSRTGSWTDIDGLIDGDQRVILPKDTAFKSLSLLTRLQEDRGAILATDLIANISDLQFFARITIYYSSRPELLLKVLNFGKSSRTRYVRNAEFSWLLRSEESDSDLIYHVVNLSQVDNERPAAVLSKSLVQRVTEAFHRLRFWKPAGGRRAGQDGQG